MFTHENHPIQIGHFTFLFHKLLHIYIYIFVHINFHIEVLLEFYSSLFNKTIYLFQLRRN